MPNLHGLADLQRVSAIRATLALGGIAHIHPGGRIKIPARHNILQMVVLFVGPGDQVLAPLERIVGKHERQRVEQKPLGFTAHHLLAHGRNLDGPQITRGRTKRLFNLFGLHGAEIFSFKHRHHLGFIQGVIATQKNNYRAGLLLPRTLRIILNLHQGQRLDLLGRRYSQEF